MATAYSCVAAVAVVIASCGSGDAFIVATPGAAGRMAVGRSRPSSYSALNPGLNTVAVGHAPSSHSARAPVMLFPQLNASGKATQGTAGGSPKRTAVSRRLSSLEIGGGGEADTDVREQEDRVVETSGAFVRGGDGVSVAGSRRDEGREAGGVRGFRQAAAVLRFVRESVERRADKTSKGMRARIAVWRRRMSVAFIGMAAAFVVMTASAGPASAFLGIGKGDAGTPMRLTSMPEEIYQQREALQEFCQSEPKDRLFDFNDLTVYEEELDNLDMFGDKIKVTYGTRESMRMKYTGFLSDQAKGGKSRGLVGAIRLTFFGSILLVVVTSLLGSVAWVFKSFVSMAKEEEVHLYGEEISVDATEKEEDELEGLDDEDFGLDDDDLEDFAKSGPSTPGDGPVSPPPSPPSGDAGESGGSQDTAGEDDDLLGL